MAGEIRNKFVSWTLNVVKEIKEIPPKNNIYGVGVNLAVVQLPPPDASAAAARTTSKVVGVESVHPHGSAVKAGLKSGDIIVQVDGKKFYNDTSNDDDNDDNVKDGKEKGYLPDDVASAIRGPEGSEVKVIVERDGKRIEFVLTRKPIGQRRAVQLAPKVAAANDESKKKNKSDDSPSSSLMKTTKTKKTKSGHAKKESGSKQSEKRGGRTKKRESSDDETQGETQEHVTTTSGNNSSSSNSSEESKTNENETANVVAVVVTPEKSKAGEPKEDEKETAKNEKETTTAASVVVTPESKKGTTAPTAVINLLDSLDSLPLSKEEEERHVENNEDNAPDLVASSSSTESDQFNAANQNCCGATSAFIGSIPLALPCAVAPSSASPVTSRSRDLIVNHGISEEKTPDYDKNDNNNNNNNEISSMVGGNEDDDDDDSQWEMISERSGSTIMISFSGSVSGTANTSFHTLTNKFVLKELTLSTGEDRDDANEIAIDHVVLPTDTLQGLCLAYKISATRLRMENGFSGNSLRMAPKKLKIPVMPVANAAANSNNADNAEGGGGSNKVMIRMQDNTSAEFKLYAFVAELPHMELVEAKAYLDLSNWDLDEALRSAREDEG